MIQSISVWESRVQRYDAGVLKRWAMITMLIDHIAAAILLLVWTPEGVRLSESSTSMEVLYALMRDAGRTAFPIFAFLIVEGFFHTHSRGRYLSRLFLDACISAVPFYLAFHPASWLPRFFDHLHLDTIFTLTAGYLCIWLIETVRNRTGNTAVPVRAVSYIAAAAGCGALMYLSERLGMDYGAWGILLILVFYLFRRWRSLCVILGYLMFGLAMSSEWYAFFGFYLIECYNGKRGRQKRSFFYWFYPVHLTALFLLRFLLTGH